MKNNNIDNGDILILLERKFPTQYEIHRRNIDQTKNLAFTTTDKEFAEKIVNSYNNNSNKTIPLSNLNAFFWDLAEDYHLWDEEEKGSYPVGRMLKNIDNYQLILNK